MDKDDIALIIIVVAILAALAIAIPKILRILS